MLLVTSVPLTEQSLAATLLMRLPVRESLDNVVVHPGQVIEEGLVGQTNAPAARSAPTGLRV